MAVFISEMDLIRAWKDRKTQKDLDPVEPLRWSQKL